jgi:hypothetical protein
MFLQYQPTSQADNKSYTTPLTRSLMEAHAKRFSKRFFISQSASFGESVQHFCIFTFRIPNHPAFESLAPTAPP